MTGANQAVLPIDESDDELARIVGELSPVLLAAATVHMSGKLDVLRNVTRPSQPRFPADQTGSLPPDDAAKLRAQALTSIKAWRDAGYPEAYVPDHAEMQEMLNFVSGIDFPDSWVPMIVEDMAMSGDARAFQWTRPVPEPRKADYPVIIVGAGMSGLLMGLRLKQAGIPFTIIERHDGVGGTWLANQYPGLRVDVPSHAYSFSFLQEKRWKHLYSLQADLRDYFEECAIEFGVRDRIRFGLEVVEAVYDESDAGWAVTVRGKDGETETLKSRAFVSCAGFFNCPSIPDFKDADAFAGPTFHTARWRHDVDLAGKRVIVIGNAATGIQLIPELVKVADRVTVFQRSAGWSGVHPEYDREITPSETWGIEHLPYYSGWMRALASNWAFGKTPDHMKIDPEWPQDGRAVSAANDLVRAAMTQGISELLKDRPDLLPKVIPDYPPFVKRPTVSKGNFFRAIQAPNCELVVDGIDRFTRTGIVDNAGKFHEADVIVYATGFKVQDYLTPMVIRGRGGLSLNEFWQDRPGGYLGMAVPGFPNFFMMYGPGTNLGYNGNQIFNGELQARYIAHCIRFMIENERDSIEVKQEAFDEYMSRTGRKLQEFVWSTGLGTTYFRNASGRVTTNSPWSLFEMWTWSQGPVAADFL